ncbi:hypothetical protein J2W40_002539 [Sphingobium xenophagum]|uniref:Uncharacterized protein n=1 Tax=Sphingobium xenophagum TaxID=121428 RepID=A0ABU1X2B2_SPHXE|nr:DUF6118 family protein [Sphingobium xenophagum]MDR7155703.1 hypothetical protein [Sphingobium xenophagum]
MTDIAPQSAITDDPSQAFEGLRREISLLHTAIQGLTAARERIPDYNPTLGAIGKQLATLTEDIGVIAQAPAVKLTPTVMVRELAKAAIDVRADDKQQMDEARAVLHQSIGRLEGIALRARTTQHQRKRGVAIGGCAFIAGILLWSFLPGVIARSLPASWHVPEWMAARMLKIEEVALIQMRDAHVNGLNTERGRSGQPRR